MYTQEQKFKVILLTNIPSPSKKYHVSIIFTYFYWGPDTELQLELAGH